MSARLKILISCYACSPYHGSEPGMGWGFVKGLSNSHELHVLVESEKWEASLRKYLASNPMDSVYFYFLPKRRARTLRKIWPPSYYWFYKEWQQKAFLKALELDKIHNFDLIHQLNMVGFREPGYLWRINKPFVWGPIGGLENSPWSFLPSLGIKGMIFYSSRNLINSWQRSHSRRVLRAAGTSNAIFIAATSATSILMKKHWNVDSTVMSEIGIDSFAHRPTHRRNNQPLRIVWSGLHTGRKNLPLLLRALKDFNAPYELHILGQGEMTKKWKSLAIKTGVSHHCIWHGWLKKEDALKVLSTCHVMTITSISDLTSTVTIEAMSFGVPVVALNHMGFTDAITNDCGFKIDVKTPRAAIVELSNILTTINNDEYLRYKLGEGAIRRSKEYQWAYKNEKLNELYKYLLNS